MTHAQDCTAPTCDGECANLPPRPERVERARAIIADLLVPDDGDQLDPTAVDSLERPELTTFTIQVPNEPRAWELASDVREAILNARFRAVVFGDLVALDGGVRMTITVQVGES